MAAVQRSPARAALYTFIAFVVCGSVPLLPYLARVDQPEWPSAIMTAAVFFAIGSVRSLWSPKSWWLAGTETLIIGMLAAGVAYAVGYGLRGLV